MAAQNVIVTEFPICDTKTVFTGTSEEDSANLKIFWKSIHLNPTIESRLVSSDVRQRIAPCPIKSHEKQKFKYREEDPPKLADFNRSVFRLESEDRHKKRQNYLHQRRESFDRHKQKKEKREKVQSDSNQRVVSVEPLRVLPPIISEYNDDLDLEKEEWREAMEAFNDIDIFEKQLSTRVQGKEPVDEHALVLD